MVVVHLGGDHSGDQTIWKGTILMKRLFGKVPFINQTIWSPGHLLCRPNKRDGLSGGAGTGGAVSHYPYSDTGYSVTPLTVTVLTCPKWHVMYQLADWSCSALPSQLGSLCSQPNALNAHSSATTKLRPTWPYPPLATNLGPIPAPWLASLAAKRSLRSLIRHPKFLPPLATNLDPSHL